MLPGPADRAVARYVRLADRLLPGRVVGVYVIGSIALGAYRRRRSDIRGNRWSAQYQRRTRRTSGSSGPTGGLGER